MDAQFLQKLIAGISERQTALYNVVYFYGDPDRVSETVAAIVAKCPGRKILRQTGADFLEETKHAILNRIWDAPDCDLYILEDIEPLAGLEVNGQRLYGVLDQMLERGTQIIVTGGSPVRDITALAARIRAQIEGGVSFCLD